MTKTQFEPSIRSRPVYGELAPRPALAHLLVADGEGGEALADLVAKADAGFLANARIVYVPGANGTDLTDKVRALGAAQFHRSPSYTAGAPRAMRALQGHHRERPHRSVPVQPLRAASVRARPLLGPPCRLSGRLYRRGRPRSGAASCGAFQMSVGAPKIADRGRGCQG